MPSSASGPGTSSSCPCLTDTMVSQQPAEKIQFPHRPIGLIGERPGYFVILPVHRRYRDHLAEMIQWPLDTRGERPGYTVIRA